MSYGPDSIATAAEWTFFGKLLPEFTIMRDAVKVAW